MAISNWDTFGITEEGKFASEFKSKLGFTIELYKNSLHIHDTKAWEEKGGFSKPIVLVVEEGNFQYKDVTIVAKRGPQNGIFVIITTGWGFDSSLKFLIGCGVYGYKGDDFVGVDDESMKFLQDWLNTHSIKTRKAIADEYDMTLNEDQIQFLMEPNYLFDKKLRAVDLSQGQRLNPGDAFFNQHFGTDVQPTDVGEAEEPVLTKILKEKP